MFTASNMTAETLKLWIISCTSNTNAPGGESVSRTTLRNCPVQSPPERSRFHIPRPGKTRVLYEVLPVPAWRREKERILIAQVVRKDREVFIVVLVLVSGTTRKDADERRENRCAMAGKGLVY